MKTLLLFLLSITISAVIYAQVPQALNYQAIARNLDGSIVSSQSIRVRFSILDGSAAGTVVYQETHQTTPNNFGVFTLAIGSGSVISGNFSGINWNTGSKFLKVEIAPQGGTNFNLQGTTQLLSVPYALYAEKSGSTGQQEPAGTNGKTVLNGTINPTAATGTNGDFYINTATNQIFGPKASGAWGTGVSLIGPAGPAGTPGLVGPAGATGATGPAGPIGAAGPQGPAGANGKTILNGVADPQATTGVDGDFYINTATNQIFGPKATGAWGTGVSLIGPAGATGATGPAGPQGSAGIAGTTGSPGPAGANGKTILSGTINPTAASGSDGDFYINTATNQIFGPKTSGSWGASVSLTGPAGATGPTGPIGPAGPQGSTGTAGATGQQGPIGLTGPAGPQGSAGVAGPAGINGKTILNGTINPTATTGVDGDFYINTATNQIFGPKTSGVWGTAVNLTGPAGPQGNAGVAGAAGATGATGPAGPMGPAGPQGSTGVAGATGPQGPVGANGKTVLSGAIDPTAATGVDGDFYINTATNQIFGPKASGAWGTAVNLTGPAGVKSLIDLQNFSGTAACPAGGITIKSGVDKDNNNILDLSEVDNTKDICFTQKASLDKLIILPIFNSIRSTSTTFPVIVGDLLKFNKNNYPLVDSIIFIADPYINGISTVTAIVNLYNKTDNIPVPNSTLTSNSILGSNQFLQTGNLYSSLPNYDIDLGISVQSSSGVYVTSGLAGCYLYLYRK